MKDLLDSFRELIEICRVKCSPLDEVILPNGRTNHEALVDAVTVLKSLGHEQDDKVEPPRQEDWELESRKQLARFNTSGPDHLCGPMCPCGE